MTGEQQVEIYKEIDDEILSVTTSKRHDYASEDDVLINFKSVSAAAKHLGIDIGNPSQYSLFMVILKIARLTNLINTQKEPNNEPIDDSFIDAINYLKLAYCCYKDK